MLIAMPAPLHLSVGPVSVMALMLDVVASVAPFLKAWALTCVFSIFLISCGSILMRLPCVSLPS